MIETQKKTLEKAISIVYAFVKGRISGKKFEREYMKIWKYMRDNDLSYPKTIEISLNELWCDVDAYVSDIKLYKELKKESEERGEPKQKFDSLNISEKELIKRAKKVLTKLKKGANK